MAIEDEEMEALSEEDLDRIRQRLGSGMIAFSSVADMLLLFGEVLRLRRRVEELENKNATCPGSGSIVDQRAGTPHPGECVIPVVCPECKQRVDSDGSIGRLRVADHLKEYL